MSHEATNWAILQRGLKPSAKLVLWHLCDAYNPEHGAFPSQEYLANACEMSRSSINNQMVELETAGLILREQRRQRGSVKQDRTRYYFAFEKIFATKKAELPCPNSGHGGEAVSVSKNDDLPCPNSGVSRVQILDSNPVKEPVKEPVNGESARDEEILEDETESVNPAFIGKAGERAFKKSFHEWPTYLSDSEPQAWKAWQRLTSTERAAAVDRQADYLEAAKATGRTKICSHGVYLSEKRWKKLGPKAEPVAADIEAKPFGKAWSAMIYRPLLAGPRMDGVRITAFEETMISSGKTTRAALMIEKQLKQGFPLVNRMFDQVTLARHKPPVVAGYFAPLLDLMEAVKVGSDLWRAWQSLHIERHWPWFPDPGKQEYVWMPAGGPDGLEAFKAAIDQIEDSKRKAAEQAR